MNYEVLALPEREDIDLPVLQRIEQWSAMAPLCSDPSRSELRDTLTTSGGMNKWPALRQNSGELAMACGRVLTLMERVGSFREGRCGTC